MKKKEEPTAEELRCQVWSCNSLRETADLVKEIASGVGRRAIIEWLTACCILPCCQLAICREFDQRKLHFILILEPRLAAPALLGILLVHLFHLQLDRLHLRHKH